MLKRKRYSLNFITLLLVFNLVYLCSCIATKETISNEITIVNICKNELPKKNKFNYILNKSTNTSTIKLSRVLFDYTNGNVTRKKVFNQKEISKIQNYYNILINDVSRIFFSDDEKGINLEIKESLNPSTSCRTNKLRVTPFFLQTLFEESLKESIYRNRTFFEDKNSIKNLNDYFELSNNDIEISNDIKDESLALEFQRTNIFCKL